MQHRMRLFLGLCTAVLFSLAPHPACGEKKANAHYTGQEIQRSFEIMTKRCGEQSDTESPGCRVLHHILAYVRYGDMFILGNDPVDVFTGEYIKDHGRGSEYLMLPEDEKQRAAAALYHVALLHVLQRLEQARDTYSLEAASDLHKAVGATRKRAAVAFGDTDLGLLDEPSDGSMWRFGSGFSVAHALDAFILGGEASLSLTHGPIWYEAGVSVHRSQISHLRLEVGPWWRIAPNTYVALRGGLGAYYDGRDTPQKTRIDPVVGAGIGYAFYDGLELWWDVRTPANRRELELFPDVFTHIGLRWRAPNTLY